MKIYLSGKITGDPSYVVKFKHYELIAVAKYRDSVIVNPAYIPSGLDNRTYMPICLAMLDACDAIYMLPDWTNSKGANLEKAYAEYQGKTVLYADT